MSARLLLTGFEPFGAVRVNPSAEIARGLDGATIGGVAITACVLPVAIGRIAGAIEDALAASRPAAVLALGVARQEAAIRLERRAVNRADFDIPDNDGLRCEGAAIEPGGPDALASTFSAAELAAALARADVPARLSDDAGTYLCNAALYYLLRRSGAIPCGLVHLPPIDEPLPPGALDLATQTRAIRLLIEEWAKVLATPGNSRIAAGA